MMSSEQTDWTTEGYQAFSNGLNGITEPVVFNETQRPQTADSEQLDTLQQARDHLREMYDQMVVRYARLLDRVEKVVGCDVDHDTVQGSHLERDGWTDVDTNFCPKCGVKL